MTRHSQSIMEQFVVSVDLRKYYSDERSRCFVLITLREGRCMSWLEQRLRSLFPQPLAGATFCLMKQGHLLPTDESICLLQPNDQVVVMPLGEHWDVSRGSTSSIPITQSQSNTRNKKQKLELSYGISNNVINADWTSVDSANSENLHNTIENSGQYCAGSEDELQRKKSRALAIVDEVLLAATAPAPSASPTPSPSPAVDRPRRRRVRRRRAPAPLAHTLHLLQLQQDTHTTKDNVHMATEKYDAAETNEECYAAVAAESNVVRNASVARSAPPRRVTAID